MNMTPLFTDYLAQNDINGYLTALHKEAENGDAGSLRILLYLSVMVSEVEDAMDYVDKLMNIEDDYVFAVWPYLSAAINELNEELGTCDNDEKYKYALGAKFKTALNTGDMEFEKEHPDFKSPFRLFGDKIIILQRAYLNHVGKQTYPVIDDSVATKPCAPKEKIDYWYSLYRRSDCSANQETIYNDAKPYAEQGDPDAMLVVGYLLAHGIETKYDSPRVIILRANPDFALPFLRRAADAGRPLACSETAFILYDQAKEHPEYRELADQYLEKGASLKDKNSLLKLFNYYKDKDDAKAFAYLVPLAEVYGTHEYDLELAYWYEKGRGCTRDEKKAFELVEYVWKNSSASPYDSSQEDSVSMLCRYLRNGIGCEKDPKRAEDIYRWYQDDEDRMMEMLTR